MDVIWNEPAPQPLRGTFLVAPVLGTLDDADTEGEATFRCDELQGLLAFEEDDELIREGEKDIEMWKERGDALLKLKDQSAAIPCYEMALQLSSQVQIGSTVLVRKGTAGIAVAEVDCMEDDTIDVTFVESQDEASIRTDEVALAASLLHSDLQTRILLNLGRCLMQLAEVDNASLARPLAYRERACLAFSLVLRLVTVDEDEPPAEQTRSKHAHSALLLRSQAYAATGKLKLATADANRLLKEAPDSRGAKKWRKTLEGRLAQHRKADKKLAKSMSRWVQTAMQTSESHSASVSDEERHKEEPAQNGGSSLPIRQVLAVLVVAIIIYQTIA